MKRGGDAAPRQQSGSRRRRPSRAPAQRFAFVHEEGIPLGRADGPATLRRRRTTSNGGRAPLRSPAAFRGGAAPATGPHTGAAAPTESPERRSHHPPGYAEAVLRQQLADRLAEGPEALPPATWPFPVEHDRHRRARRTPPHVVRAAKQNIAEAARRVACDRVDVNFLLAAARRRSREHPDPPPRGITPLDASDEDGARERPDDAAPSLSGSGSSAPSPSPSAAPSPHSVPPNGQRRAVRLSPVAVAERVGAARGWDEAARWHGERGDRSPHASSAPTASVEGCQPAASRLRPRDPAAGRVGARQQWGPPTPGPAHRTVEDLDHVRSFGSSVPSSCPPPSPREQRATARLPARGGSGRATEDAGDVMHSSRPDRSAEFFDDDNEVWIARRTGRLDPRARSPTGRPAGAIAGASSRPGVSWARVAGAAPPRLSPPPTLQRPALGAASPLPTAERYGGSLPRGVPTPLHERGPERTYMEQYLIGAGLGDLVDLGVPEDGRGAGGDGGRRASLGVRGPVVAGHGLPRRRSRGDVYSDEEETRRRELLQALGGLIAGRHLVEQLAVWQTEHARRQLLVQDEEGERFMLHAKREAMAYAFRCEEEHLCRMQRCVAEAEETAVCEALRLEATRNDLRALADGLERQLQAAREAGRRQQDELDLARRSTAHRIRQERAAMLREMAALERRLEVRLGGRPPRGTGAAARGHSPPAQAGAAPAGPPRSPPPAEAPPPALDGHVPVPRGGFVPAVRGGDAAATAASRVAPHPFHHHIVPPPPLDHYRERRQSLGRT